ncbi:MAG: NBR1-Ig-like domain-containing protein [Anaerolineae bacterium]
MEEHNSEAEVPEGLAVATEETGRSADESGAETDSPGPAEHEAGSPGSTLFQRLAAIFTRKRGQASESAVAAAEEHAPNPERRDETEAAAAPTGPTLRERLAITFAPARERFGTGLGRLGTSLTGGGWVYGIIAILVIGALVLPPISLPRRLGLVGFTRINAGSSSLSHPDGITVRVEPEDGVSLRVSLDTIPRVDFLDGEAGLEEAVAAVPDWLEVKSPYYRIEVFSSAAGPATLEVVIPNEAEPWETLDLYTWTGSAWEWVGGALDSEREVLAAKVTQLPSSVVVMQTAPVVPAIATTTSEPPEGEAAEILTEVLLPGLYLGTDGTLLGQVPTLNSEDLEQMLLIRDWRDDEPLSPALLTDVLNRPDIQDAHIEQIVTKTLESDAAGIALDYRAVDVDQRESFSQFVGALADKLHAQNLQLEVRVPAPIERDGAWETGGYDWAALGAAADALLIPFPREPEAYAEGGEVQSLLDWAVGEVSRYKLRAVVSSLCTDVCGEEVKRVPLEEALAPFGDVQSSAEAELEPGQEVTFAVVGQVTSIVLEESVGTYAVTYQAEDETEHTVWLGTPSFLARKLEWALRYHLGGVLVNGVLDEGNMPGVLEAVASYRVAAEPPPPTEMEVTWAVEGPSELALEETTALTRPHFRWVAPSEPGMYAVSASVAGVSWGSVELAVAEPTPEVTPLTVEEAACLEASFVEDVTVPDGTQFDNGEAFVKTWRLRNSGTCDWPEETVLVFRSGSQMGGADSVPVGAVAAGETKEISVQLTAPEEAGNFTGLWVLKAGDTEISGGEVSVVIRAGEVAGAPPPPPAPVSGGSFELGGHVRDLGLPYANLMHYAGMNWAKVQVHYGQDASGIIQAAHANGFKIQLSALGTPSMVTQPGFEQDFASWVAGLAAGGADAIEVWNEPNIDREWQVGHIDPAAYTQLLCTAYQAIKGANPNALVISAAPAPTGWFGGCGPNGCDDLPWIQGMYNAGAAQCMDYLGAHHNAGATSPSATSGHPADHGDAHHSWYFLPQTQLYYDAFGGARQLFYTEMGYASQEGLPTFSDQFAWARGTDNSEQAAWLSEAVQLSVQTGMVRCIIVWNIDFPRYGYDPQDGYAIVRPGGSCPACDALHGVLGTR